MDSFEFESGRTLEDVTVKYATSGIPKYDDEGNIVNAIVYCPTLNGGHAILPQYHSYFQENNFKKNEYFFIRIYSLGTPGSCSPSTTALKYNFPSYTFKDRVNFKRQFLSEKFNIKKILGIIGEGIGGFEVFTWACEYPDEMEFIILLNSVYKLYGSGYVVTKSLESMIDAADDFYSDNYSSSLSRLSVSLLRLLFMAYFPEMVFESLSNDELDVLMDDYVDDGLFMDIYDFKFRNDSILRYNVEDELSNIKAKSLFIGTAGYLFFYPENDLIPLGDMVEGSRVCVFESTRKTYYEEVDNSDIINEIMSFLNQFRK